MSQSTCLLTLSIPEHNGGLLLSFQERADANDFRHIAQSRCVPVGVHGAWIASLELALELLTTFMNEYHPNWRST